MLLTLIGATTRSTRDCIAAAHDCALICADEALGVRVDEVFVRHRYWSGAAPGDGTYTDVDTELQPPPRSVRPDPEQTANPYGTFSDGTVMYDQVSLAYSESFLGDPDPGDNRAPNHEVFWVINGEQYSVIKLDEEYPFRVATLRRRRGN